MRVHNDHSGQEEEITIDAAQQQSSKKVSFAPEVERHQQLKLRYAQGTLNQSPDATEILREDASNQTDFDVDEPPLNPEDPELQMLNKSFYNGIYG